MAAPTLSTTRYVEVGTYIGQYFLPGAGGLPNDVRVPALVGKGDRLFSVKNLPFRRSFISGEALTFTSIAPFIANTAHVSNGSQSLPVKLYTLDGTEVSVNKWVFLKNMSGNYVQVQIIDTAFDPLAQYILDYQSLDRTVKDQIPVVTLKQLSTQAQVRQITALGTLQDQEEFKEYIDFFGDFEVDAPVADPGNLNPTSSFTSVTTVGTGTGVVTVSPSAAYSHLYNRVYNLEVTAAGGLPGSRTATLAWSATPVSFGNNALPSTPINPAETRPTITLSEIAPLTMSNILLELGVVLDFDFGASNFVIGDMFHLQGNGAGLIELDPRLAQSNQFSELSEIEPDLMVLSTGVVTYASTPLDYLMTSVNMNFRVECIQVTGSSPTRTATFVWAGYGMAAASGSFVVNEAVTGSDVQTLGATGIKLSLNFGATHFVVGDRFIFEAKAPRLFYKGKESVRSISLSISNVSYPAANRSLISGGFLANTPEGRYGTWSADTSVNNGRFEINDGLLFFARNTYVSTLVNPVPGGSMVAVGDAYGLQARFMGTLNFSLMQEVTQIFTNPADIATDVTGAVTGSTGAKYVTLEHMSQVVISMTRISDSTPVPFSPVAGTPFLLITVPFGLSDGDVKVVYRWNGGEPEPGQAYYMTGKFLRPEEMYNTPFLFLTKADAEAFLGPSTVRNDLYIGSEIVWDNAVAGLICIQVKDADDDGVFSRDDYRTAINHFLDDKRATDLVVLNFFGSLADQLNVINRANDPFEVHESLTYVGCPIGTPVGSELQPGSLVFYSRKTLAVFGNSPAHGTRILVGSTRATRTIQLDDKSSTSVTLDGSFVAAAMASKVAAFTDPRATVLLTTVTSFDTMEVHTPEENLQLGGNNVIYFKDEGNGVYRVMEDITTDPFSPDTLNINQMTQKQFVTRDIRRYMTQAIIGLVFPSASAGVFSIQAALATRLRILVARSLIGQYQDDSGNVRDLSIADTLVFRDTADPTAFNIGYNYFLATTAKRIFGLFTVNMPGGFPK